MISSWVTLRWSTIWKPVNLSVLRNLNVSTAPDVAIAHLLPILPGLEVFYLFAQLWLGLAGHKLELNDSFWGFTDTFLLLL